MNKELGFLKYTAHVSKHVMKNLQEKKNERIGIIQLSDFCSSSYSRGAGPLLNVIYIFNKTTTPRKKNRKKIKMKVLTLMDYYYYYYYYYYLFIFC